MGLEFVLDTPVVRGFVGGVKAEIAAASSPAEACDRIRPRFAELLADPDWLPAQYLADAPESRMGGGMGPGMGPGMGAIPSTASHFSGRGIRSSRTRRRTARNVRRRKRIRPG